MCPYCGDGHWHMLLDSVQSPCRLAAMTCMKVASRAILIVPVGKWPFAIDLNASSKGGSGVSWHGQDKTAAGELCASDWPAQSGVVEDTA